MFRIGSITFLFAAIILISCSKEEDGASLNFQFRFNPAQERLDNFGALSVIPAGHAAITPDYNSMSAHYIELVPDKFTLLGNGAIIYKGKEVTASNDGFTTAIDFKDAKVSDENKIFLKVPIKNIPPGTYKYIRVSVTYQNYDIRFNIKDVPAGPVVMDLNNQKGTIASFLGYNTKIGTQSVRTMQFTENAPKIQGYWAFESNLDSPYNTFNRLERGSSPAGGTTVVNPLEAFGVTVPRGSCIVTGELSTPLIITGTETTSKLATLSFSINKSFEWEDTNSNGEFDLIYPSTVEKIVDMGLRGLKVTVTE